MGTYFNFIQMQKRQMACTTSCVKKSVVRKDRQPLKNGVGKTPRTKPQFRPTKEGEKIKRKAHQFCPGTRALMEIQKLQKSVGLLIPKRPFYWVVKEILQAERSWLKIQASAIMALHEVAEAYLVRLLGDGHIGATHAKRITLMPKDICLARQIMGENNGLRRKRDC